MTIIPFPDRVQTESGGWRSPELQQLMQIFATHAASGEASDWKIGATEAADPQFYVFGSAPANECILSVSRVRQVYVLEDGGGRVLADSRSLREIADKALRVTFEAKKASIIARAVVFWCVARQTIEEKIEPLLAEPMEVLTHFAPQLAAFA
jgi:hypothetical protein